MSRATTRVSAIQIALVLIVLASAAWGLTRAGQRSGAENSSLVRTSVGFSYWYDVLDQLDRPLARLREPIGPATLVPTQALVMVVLSEEIHPDEWPHLQQFVDEGGWLITSFSVFEEVVDGVRLLPASLDRFQRPPLFTGETQQVRLTTSGDGGHGATGRLGPAIPLLADPGGLFGAVAADVGRGRVVGLSSDLVRNGNILAEDNLRFAVQVTGDRPVVFNEFVQGYEIVTDVVPLPEQRPWPWVLGAAALGALLWSLGHRFGAPVPAGRDLAPARSDYVDAMASVLAGTDPDHSTYDTLLERALRAARVDSLTALEDRAEVYGLTAHDLHVLARPPATDRSLIEMARSVHGIEQRLHATSGREETR